MTGHSTADDLERVLRAGYQAHLPKPVDADRLLAVVAGLANPPTAAQPLRSA